MQDNSDYPNKDNSKFDVSTNQTQNIETMLRSLSEEIKQFEPLFFTEYCQGTELKYQQTLKERYHVLIRQLQPLDINSDGWIHPIAIHNFFKNYKGIHSITELSIERWWVMMNRRNDEGITVHDFIFGFIKIEERWKWKIEKWNHVRKELEASLQQFQQRERETRKERLNNEGLCNNATWSINLLNATDLKSLQPGAAPNVFVLFNLNGKKQISKTISENNNPEFNEDFVFPVETRGEVLKVEVYETSTFNGKQWIGKTNIIVTRFENQWKSKESYALYLNNDTTDDRGVIQWIIRYIYDWNKYYNTVVATTHDQIVRLDKDLRELNRYNTFFKEPFGIITAGEIDKIVDNNIFYKSDEVWDYIANARQSIYIEDNKPGVEPSKPVNTNEDPLLNQDETISVQVDKKIRITAAACLGLCWFNFFNRYDCITLLWILLWLSSIELLVKLDGRQIKYLVFGFLGTLLYDIVWFFSDGVNFTKSNYYCNLNILLFVFIVSIVAFVVKFLLVVFVLLALRTSKSSGPVDKISNLI